jgi:hypothetical protein
MRGSCHPEDKKLYVMPHFTGLELNVIYRYIESQHINKMLHFSTELCPFEANLIIGWMSSKGYIRDAAFDPRRWLAPGQLSIWPCPCKCPENSEGMTEYNEKSIVIGKPCDKGHRWICSKTTSDCVEAIIGAYYVGGGLRAAVAVLKWLHIDVEVEEELITKAISSASMRTYLPKVDLVELLEAKLGYIFSAKGLLIEALTHPSQQESGATYCYQVCGLYVASLTYSVL